MTQVRPIHPNPRQAGETRRIALTFCLGAGAFMAAVAFREPIVRIAPHAAVAFSAIGVPVNLTGLNLNKIAARIAIDGPQRILTIGGDIANPSRKPKQIPPIRVSLRDDDGQIIYAWTLKPPQHSLAAGERIAFSARLAAPPKEAGEALVSFEEGKDIKAAPPSQRRDKP